MKKTIFFLLLISLIFAISCTKENENLKSNDSDKLSRNSEDQLGIPFATDEELSLFENYEDIIHYKVARYYAYISIEKTLYEPLNLEQGNYRLTEKPVIIYDYDCKPKYYEFGIYSLDGEVIKTITTIAKKESSNICAFLFNQKMDYSEKNDNDYFIGAYPSPLLGKVTSIGSSPENLHYFNQQEIIEIPSTNVIENFQNIINNMDQESQTTHLTAIDDLQNQITENQEGLAEFWSIADADKDRIVTLSDDEIINEAYNVSDRSCTTWDSYTIPAYNNENLKKTHWEGWCGPSAIAWAYRGLYSNYHKTSSNYLRIRGSSNFLNFYNTSTDRAIYAEPTGPTSADYNLYSTLLSHCATLGSSRPMFESGMNAGMKEITNNEYKINYCTEPHNRIRDKRLPIFEMINIGGFGGLHYLCGFGSSYERRCSGSIKSKWILLTDNGYRTSHYGLYPYWRNQSPDPGLFYKVLR